MPEKNSMHTRLQKQVAESFGPMPAALSPELEKLLSLVSQSYRDWDAATPENEIENQGQDKSGVRGDSRYTTLITSMEESFFPFQTFFEQDIVGIYRTTPSGSIINCNQAFANMLGYNSPSEMHLLNAAELYFAKGTRDSFIDSLRKQKTLHNHEPVLKCKDGSMLHVLENVVLYIDPATGEEFCNGVVVDITAKTKAETELRDSEKRYRQIVETSQEGIWTIDKNNLTSFVNNRLCEMFEYTAEEMLGKAPYEFMDEDEKEKSIERIERRKKGIVENAEMRYTTKNGKTVWAHISAAAIYNSNGEYEGSLGMITDITETKKAAIEREKLIDDLIQRNKDLRQFDYIVSHNLRAPVTNIIGLTTLLEDETADANMKKILREGIATSAKSLDDIIKDLSYMLQVREQVKERKEQVDLNYLLKNIEHSISNIIAEQSVVISSNFTEVNSLFTIRTYLHSIFYNLIFNSIKYRQANTAPVINISIVYKGENVQLVFEDNGKGIDLKRHNKDLFGLYKRFDKSVEGKGMGLFMVKTQVESLGGKIRVESELNKGTRFIIEFPV